MKTPVGPDVMTVEAERPTASIIAFPERGLSASVRDVAPAPRRDDRLAQALLSLDSAMQRQRTAVAAWRDALNTLQATNEGLASSLRRYQSSLTSLRAGVLGLQAKTRALEQWADGASTGSSPAG